MTRGRPREFDRDEALEAVMEKFWEQGFDATGLADLEECTGLGRQSIYNAFGDKRTLFIEALERYEKNFLDPIIDTLGRDGSPMANLRAVLDLWDARTSENREHGCLFANSLAELGDRDPEMRRVLSMTLRRLEQAFVGALTRAQRSGELPGDRDPRALARLFTTIGQGLSVVGKTQEPQFGRDALRAARALIE